MLQRLRRVSFHLDGRSLSAQGKVDHVNGSVESEVAMMRYRSCRPRIKSSRERRKREALPYLDSSIAKMKSVGPIIDSLARKVKWRMIKMKTAYKTP